MQLLRTRFLALAITPQAFPLRARKRTLPFVLFCVLAASWPASLASAQEVPSAGKQAGHRFDIGVGLGAQTSESDNGVTFSGSVRYYPARFLALEAEAGWWNGYDDSVFRPVHGTTELSGSLLVGFFGQSQVKPYVGLGLCNSRTTVRWNDYTNDDSFTDVHFIVGLDVRISSRVSAFGTARFRPVVVGDFDGWRTVTRYQVGARLAL